jgi:hypothetical protein
MPIAMKAASLTACALACLLLAGCAENAVPSMTTIQPLDTPTAFTITGVECAAAPGVAMTASDLERNTLFMQAALESIRLVAVRHDGPAKKPLRLKILFTSYRRARESVWKVVPLVSAMQETAVLSFVDDNGQSIGQYRVYGGAWVGTALVSAPDIETGVQQGILEFVRNTGMDIAILKPS